MNEDRTDRRGKACKRESGGGQRGSQTGGGAQGQAVTELFLGPDLAPQEGASSDGAPGKGKEVLLDIGVGGTQARAARISSAPETLTPPPSSLRQPSGSLKTSSAQPHPPPTPLQPLQSHQP